MLWKWSKFAVLAGSLMLAACGGGSSSTPASNTTDVVNVPGSWSGTYQLSSASGSTKVTTGAVTEDGFGFFADDDGYVFVLIGLPGASPFTSALTGVAPPGETFSNGYKTVNFSVSGTYAPSNSGISVQASLTEDDGNGNLSGSFNLASKAAYSGSSTLTGLQGQWSGYYIGKAGTSADLAINGATGAFTGNDGYGCNLSGNITQTAPAINLYYVNLKSAGSGCAGVLNGLAYEGASDTTGVFGGATGTYLYINVLGPNIAYVMELKM
ncbi:MAG: hypothetical protein ACRESE_06000 [Gammaproteobacteria bacterium]